MSALTYAILCARGAADRLRWRVCVWLCPQMPKARGKRELERVARDCGASRSMARHIASEFFRG